MRLRYIRPILPLMFVLGATLTGCALATKAPPVADAGPDIIVHLGETVSFDGSLSVDLDGGKIVYYHWSIRAAPEGLQDEVGRVLQEGDVAVYTTDLAMSEDNLGQWTIELRVTDDEGQSATDEMMLAVIP
ncbi:MAG: PKD domain-containing protein [Anaerolineae bacterium]